MAVVRVFGEWAAMTSLNKSMRKGEADSSRFISVADFEQPQVDHGDNMVTSSFCPDPERKCVIIVDQESGNIAID